MNNDIIKIFLLVFLFQNLMYSQSLENKNVLVVYQLDPYHKPKIFVEKVAKWLESQKANIVISDDLNTYSNKELMSSIDLVIQTVTMGSLTSSQEKGLTNAIKSGTGIAGSHGGLGDSFRNNTLYQFMIGGQFVSHPGGNVNYTVEFTKPRNSLTKNIPNFKIKSEQYYMHIDPSINILASTKFSGQQYPWIKNNEMPVCWTKVFGEGKVFYLSVGHSPDNFDIPEVWELLTRGFKWASKN
jgi:type 1 glutamine amidotransferase|tara:strand:+ start:1818 stop:2540 length:723 start_codon:yes stop_codon:yes gene_type:complete